METLDGVRNHSWRRPAPATPEGEVVAWADRIAYVCHDFEDAVRAGIVEPAELPATVRDVVGARPSEQIGAFMRRCSTPSTVTGAVGMTEPAADALADVPRVQLRADLPAAGRAPPGRRGSCACSAPRRALRRRAADALPMVARRRGAGTGRGLARGRRAGGHHVSGMTDRFALGLGVELLGWRPDDLPRGV